MEYVLSLSYGKDSLACLGAIEELGWPLDRIVHAEVWATDTIPADLPPMVEFKAKADKRIKELYGIEVEHVKAEWTFEKRFYSLVSQKAKKEYAEKTRGWPLTRGSWCLRDLKLPAMRKRKNTVYYVGIAKDEPERFAQLCETVKSPLVELNWTEAWCKMWCEMHGLLSPIYKGTLRGGCWFCPKQPLEQIRLLRKNYPEYWEMMLKWDLDSPVTFKPDGHTVHDFDRRFQMEDDGFVKLDERWRWEYLESDLINYRLF